MTNSNKNFCKPFRELIKSERNEVYFVRLGLKTYIIKSKKNIDEFFRWGDVQVLDPRSDQPRPIMQEELVVKWFKPSIKAVVNYQKACQPQSMASATRDLEAKRKAKDRYASNWKG